MFPIPVEKPVDPGAVVSGTSFAAAQDSQSAELLHALVGKPDERDRSIYPKVEPRPGETLVLKTQGLIRVDGDVMTYIVSNPGGPRPASFDTTPSDGLTKVILGGFVDAA